MALTMEKLRAWAVADESQDTELKMAWHAAEGYLQAAGVPEVDSPARDMALMLLAVYFFEQRAPGAANDYAPMPPALRPMIHQLRLEKTEEDGGGAE